MASLKGRRVWYIDVGDMTAQEAQKAIKDAMEPKKVRVWLKPYPSESFATRCSTSFASRFAYG